MIFSGETMAMHGQQESKGISRYPTKDGIFAQILAIDGQYISSFVKHWRCLLPPSSCGQV